MGHFMEKLERLVRYTQSLAIDDLPIAAYVVTEDGRIVGCNRRLRQILKLPETGRVSGSLADYYVNRDDRSALLEKLRQRESRGCFLEKEIIHFKTGEDELWVQDCCRSVTDPKTGEVLGYFGCLVDITEEHSFHKLFDQLPAGFYQLDKHDRFINLNSSLATMLGYSSPVELIGRDANDLYVDSEEAQQLAEDIRTHGEVYGRKVELESRDGSTLIVLVSASRMETHDGRYTGRQGTIVDVTAEEKYRTILDAVPMGTYMVRNIGDQEIIVECNEAFAEMFGYESSDELKGRKVIDLYQNPEESYKRLMHELRKAHESKSPLVDFPLEVKSATEEPFVIEVNSQLMTDKNGREIGRAGVVRDISDEVALRELRDDIGRVLHTYSSMLVLLRHSIEPVINALSPDPFEGSLPVDLEMIFDNLEGPILRLEKQLCQFMSFADEKERGNKALPANLWQQLKSLSSLVTNRTGRIRNRQAMIPTLRDVARSIIGITWEVETGYLPKERIKELRRSAKELERICCLAALHQANDTIITMDHQVRAFREFVTLKRRRVEEKRSVSITDILDKAIQGMTEFARSRRVEIIPQEIPSVTILVRERNFTRAIENLLHNAIKYSWSHADGSPAYVRISGGVENNTLWLEFENYGVPITREELDNGLVFEVGFRGSMSGDRGRLGTGIGLPDAREVARSHGGDVTITSQPASEHPGDDYSNPFVTRTKLTIQIDQ
jgi:PAS domain S-box-containing protein